MRFDRDLRRKWVDRIMSGAALACVLIALLPLASILYTSAVRGIAAMSLSFFTAGPPVACPPSLGTCAQGGIANAIQGTLVLVGIAGAISLPIGILTGIYTSEFGRNPLGRTVRFVADVMTGLPSIVAGIFVFALFEFAVAQGWLPPNYVLSVLAGSTALAVIMIPIVARTSEEALQLVPRSTREAALALGIPRHRVILRVVLSTGRTAVITGALLATARAAGETAPLIVTDFGNTFAFQGLGQPTASLPLSIFYWAISPYANLQADAWGATLVLVTLMLGISLLARFALRQRFQGVPR